MSHLNRLLISFITLIFIQSPSFSATKSTATPASTSRAFGPSNESSKILVLTGLGLMDYMGHFGFSFFGDLLFKISEELPIYLGAETGLDIHESYRYDWYTTSASGYTGMPLVATAIYRFQLPRIPDLHPYAGLALGPYFSLSSGRSVVLEMIVRPGISWKVSHTMALTGEARFGVIGGGFFICPVAALTFFL